MITTRRSLLVSLGLALPVAAFVTAGNAAANTTATHHHAKAHSHATHATHLRSHAKTHRTASAQRSHAPKA